MAGDFNDFHLRVIEPKFDSALTDFIIDLDHLRKRRLSGTTKAGIFFQIKDIFHMLESIGSARIEGNRTTIIEYIETKIDKKEIKDEKLLEIFNMEKAMEFIDQNIRDYPINRMFLSELHKMVVKDLSSENEGDRTPGEYRMGNVRIAGASHVPPDYTQVSRYMDELFQFINESAPSKYDLLRTALAHHRFVWVHPFSNGNGRTVRLFTYAMLVKQGFNIDVAGRIVNPTAVFCIDRNKYYQYLSHADTGKDEGLLQWCEYVLGGLKGEIEKIDKLVDHKYLSAEVLLPAIKISLERKVITDNEAKILRVAVEKQLFQASDVKHLFPNKLAPEVSRILRNLKDKKMISTTKDKGRKYMISFNNNYLLRGIITMLGEKGFLPIKDEK